MPNFAGGAPLPVTTGGQGKTEQRAAVPVYVVSDGQAPIGQRARRVVVVTTGPVEGGAAIPVFDAGASALYSDEPALPVYVVQGSLGSNPLAYTNKVKALSPIAYWPLADTSGTTATDESGNGRNGTYTGVTLGQPGIGDGRTAALFVPGSNSKVNVFSASLQAALSGAEGTMAAWFMVSGAGVWTDGAQRQIEIFLVDGSNSIRMNKNSANNTLSWIYVAGGTTKSRDRPATNPTGWTHVAMTWSKAADQVKFYLNGAQDGATLNGLGVFAGSLSSTFATLGAGDNTAGPSAKWDGNLAHCALWNTPLSAAQIASLAVVP